MKRIFQAILFFVSNCCFADMVGYSTLKQIREGQFDRYIFVRGERLKSPIDKLKEHGKLGSPGPSVIYEFNFSETGGWTIFKLPSSSSHWMFHNLSYWFLGWGEEDPNYADSIIGLAISKNKVVSSYAIYGSNDEKRPEDSLYGKNSLGTSFVVNIPFDELLVDHQSQLPGVPEIVGGFKMTEALKFNALKIEYHESLGQTIH